MPLNWQTLLPQIEALADHMKQRKRATITINLRTLRTRFVSENGDRRVVVEAGTDVVRERRKTGPLADAQTKPDAVTMVRSEIGPADEAASGARDCEIVTYGVDGVLLMDALEFALITLRDQSRPSLAAQPADDDDLASVERVLRQIETQASS